MSDPTKYLHSQCALSNIGQLVLLLSVFVVFCVLGIGCRMVFEWMLIPQQFLRANLHSVDGDILKSWIESNLPSSPMLRCVFPLSKIG